MKQENQRKIYQTSWGQEIVLEPNERLIDKLYEIFCADCPKAHRCHNGCCEFEDPYVCDNLALNMRKDYIMTKQTLTIEDEEELKQIQETLDKIVDIYFFRR